MAPEQIAGDAVDHRADIYAWGLIAYELLSGAHPFPGKTNAAQLFAAQLAQAPTPLAEKTADIPPQLAQLVMLCLRKSPNERPPSAAELLENLHDTYESREKVSLPRARPTRRTAAISALVLAASLAVGAYAYSTRSSSATAPVTASSVAVLPFSDDRADATEAYFGEA